MRAWLILVTMKGLSLYLFLSFLLLVTVHSEPNVGSVPNGTIILSRNGVSHISYTSGTVRVYYNNIWGNICKDSFFGSNAADVICHQLGYTGATSYTNDDDEEFSIIWSFVSCASSDYLSISQCSYSTTISNSCNQNGLSDVSVYCNPVGIWDNPFAGMVHLQGGDYSNRGRVEVYCNEKWGTICTSRFDANDASTICRQLGYDTYYDYNFEMLLADNSSQPVWSNNMTSGLGDQCFLTSNTCPASTLPDCAQNVILSCGTSTLPDSTKVTLKTCNNNKHSYTRLIEIISGSVGGFIVVVICIIIIACVCCVCVTRRKKAILVKERKEAEENNYPPADPPPQALYPQLQVNERQPLLA